MFSAFRHWPKLHAPPGDPAKELLGEEEVHGEAVEKAEVPEEQTEASQEEKWQEIEQET